MAFISSMAKTEKFERFKEYLRYGYVKGVKENLEPEFVDEIIEIFSGERPIHWACLSDEFEIVNLLIEEKCNIESEDKLGMRPIHLAWQEDHFEIANLLIEKKCNIESEDKWGMRPIHYACLNSSKEIVKLLIAHNCLLNVSDKLVLQKYVDKIKQEIINNHHSICISKERSKLYKSKNIIDKLFYLFHDGRTPLDKAKSKGHREIVKLLSELDKITKQINDSILKNDDKNFAKLYKSDLLTGRNWLEISWKQKADKIIKHFLDRPIDVTEIGYIKNVIENHSPESTNADLWKEVLLYKSMKDEKGFQYICRPNIINRPKKIIPCSFLELAAENGNFILVQEIMRKSFYDSEVWKRAKEISLGKGYSHIHNSISRREYLLKCREKNNISILHTAVCDNDPDMLEYILREGLVDVNHNHEVLGTALAFSILLCHRECLKVFGRFNIDCNTQNKYLQSPLHEAISNGMVEHCQYIMDRVENIDQPRFMGQTALHCAVIRGCEGLCDQLIEKGADCLRYMEFYQPLTEKKGTPISKESLKLSQRENSLTLCVKMNRTIYPCFLKSLDRNKADSSDDEGVSLLHLSAKLMKPNLCKVLLQGGANIDSINKKGKTPLFELLSNLDQRSFIRNEDKIIETVNLFVQSGCDLDKGLKGDLSLTQIITKFNSERLLVALLPRHQNQLFEIDENLLRIALARNFYQFCKSVLNLFPKEHLKFSISTNVIEEALKHDCTQLLKSLVFNASDDVQQGVLELSLYYLAKQGDKDSFECLLNIEIKNPFHFGDGESLLTRLFIEERLYFCQRIIKSKVNKKYINFKNEKNQTSLQVAIETDSLDVILNDLAFETDVIDNIDCESRTALIQLIMKISVNKDEDRHSRLMNAIKTIICKGGNIYHKTSNGKTAIESCSSSLCREEIETFQNNQNNFTNTVREKIIEREKVVVVKEVKIERNNCGICLEREVDSVFECGHTICEVCSDEICSSEISRCPFCNFEPVRAKRIYFN